MKPLIAFITGLLIGLIAGLNENAYLNYELYYYKTQYNSLLPQLSKANRLIKQCNDTTTKVIIYQ